LLRCTKAEEFSMPLSPPQEREPLHSRDIVLRGYQRTDGLYDIEAQLTDTKTYGFGNLDRGYVRSGEPIHGMWIRLTVDERRNIVACEAASDHTPYSICPTAAPNFARLAGLQIRPGFLKEATKRVGGTHGCTHLRELLQQMATTAYQTIDPARGKRDADPMGDGDGRGSDKTDEPPAILNSCIAYGSASPVVKRQWPHLYTGPAE
jgi:hypothetical protein